MTLAMCSKVLQKCIMLRVHVFIEFIHKMQMFSIYG